MDAADVPSPPLMAASDVSAGNGSAAMAIETPMDPDPDGFSLPPATEDEELPADFERLWRAAHETPQDFTSWTDLLQYCEQEVCVIVILTGNTQENNSVQIENKET